MRKVVVLETWNAGGLRWGGGRVWGWGLGFRMGGRGQRGGVGDGGVWGFGGLGASLRRGWGRRGRIELFFHRGKLRDGDKGYDMVLDKLLGLGGQRAFFGPWALNGCCVTAQSVAVKVCGFGIGRRDLNQGCGR